MALAVKRNKKDKKKCMQYVTDDSAKDKNKVGIKRERQSTIFHCLQREGLWEVEQLEINEGAEPEQMCGGEGEGGAATRTGAAGDGEAARVEGEVGADAEGTTV